jgi:hypothetical protein
MKNRMLSFSSYAVLLLCWACAGNDPEPDQTSITHTGEKWNITALEYNVVDQNFKNPSIKNGTTANAGAFYFDGSKGSFDFKIDDIHKEDVFGLVSGSSGITVTSIEQSVQGMSFSQNVIVLSGDKPSGSSMTLSGTITQQSLNGQFVLTGTFTLTKQ